MTRKQMKLLDDLWRDAIRSIGYCEKCGKTSGMQAHHIFAKGHHRILRWNLLNGICLCYRCHIHWAHADSVSFVRWLEDYKGARLIDGLTLESQRDARYMDFDEIKASLELTVVK